MNGRFHIGLVLSNDFLLFHIYYYQREFNDLVKGKVFGLVFTLALKVVDHDIIKGRLIDPFTIFEIAYRSEVVWRNVSVDA